MSTAQKMPPTNGTKKDVSEAPKLTVAVSPVKPIETPGKKDVQEIAPLEDRLHRLNQLFNLQTKYNKYTESLQKLNDFEIKKDGERSSISISDDSRNNFSTYHPEIVQEVVEFLKVNIKQRIKAIEPQLRW
jgi:hypothetical protein